MRVPSIRVRVACLAFSLVLALIAATPAESCDFFSNSYSDSSVVVIGGVPVCAGHGGSCSEFGCSGQGYCVADGLIMRCYQDVP